MRTIQRFLLIVSFSPTWLLPLAGCKTPGEAGSEVLREVDDRETDRTSKLVDIDKQFEFFINRVLKEERAAAGLGVEPGETEIAAFLERVYARLGADAPGTGVVVGVAGLGKEISSVTHVEQWFAQTFAEDAGTIAYLKFDDTWYKDNPVGLQKGRVWAHMTRQAADHSIAPVTRMRGVLVGADKWGHFFQQGYWNFKSGLERKDRWELGLYLEGDPIAESKGPKYRQIITKFCTPCAVFGYYGSYTSGVVSYADIYAGEFGWRFYSELSRDPQGYVFSLASLDLRFLNETHIRSQTTGGVVISPEP